MNQLQQLNLTEDDFKLIIAGLEFLPHKDMAGEMVGELMLAMFSGKDEQSIDKLKRQREMEKRKRDSVKEVMVENIKILQGKLLSLKRYLREQGALKEANDIINP